MENKRIFVKGAREHNLRSVDVEIPRDQLVCITGLSGSGKSSLAFDTIYAEGQRRYVESLSAYARQFLEMMQKPDVDYIEGLSPAISIEQKTTSKNPRSTVGTVTEIYDYLRLLYARAGIPISPATGEPITAQTVSDMVDAVMEMEEGKKIYLLAPIVRGRKGEYKRELMDLQKRGFQRVKIDGTIYEMDDLPTIDKNKKHDIEVVVDRLKTAKEDDALAQRLADSIEQALDLSDGLLFVDGEDGDDDRRIFSAKFACPVSGFTIEEIEPRLFSFNNPFGACPSCDGLGVELFFDPELIVPNEKLSLREGAIAPWAGSTSKYYPQVLAGLTAYYKADMDTPWIDLPEKFKTALLHGTGETNIPMRFADGLRTYQTNRPFEGIIPNFKRRWLDTSSDNSREDIGKYQGNRSCKACGGARLREEALAVKLDGQHIGEISNLSIEQALIWSKELPKKLNKNQQKIADRILREISERLGFLNNVGLSYLTLSRKSGTLSGGESQRIRLASQIGSGLTGVLYVLDEPSIGLHQRDNERLLESLKRLRDLGNSVLVVEHDEDTMREADYLIDMGPGAGTHGGILVAAGTPEEVMACKDSITADYLTGRRKIEVPKKRRPGKPNQKLRIIGASSNNLQNVSAEFPLGTLTCVTGVSGGGKSTLTIETLYKELAKRLNGARTQAGKFEAIKGVAYLDKVIDIDQSPIGRTPRSNPATYTGAFTPIREWYTNLPEAKARGYSAGRFSFNVKGGRCEACQGDGVIKIEMHFLPDVYVTCEACHGHRYARETLEIKWKGKSISDVLEMTVEEGVKFFRDVPAVYDRLKTLERVGLGYIKIGQQATTLSGGEAQRIKLSKELSRKATGRTLYILDEPTTGLHFEDVRKLLEVLNELVENGNTVVVIEHNIEVIKTADWIIDLGPEGGDHGGEIVAIGTPEDVAAVDRSYTGHYLREHLPKIKKTKKSA